MRLLLVTTRLPWPPRRGNQLRTLEVARWLARQHAVTVLAPARAGEDARAAAAGEPFALDTYRRPAASAALGAARAALGGRPLQTGLFDVPDLARALARHAPRVDGCVLELVRLSGALDVLSRLRPELPFAVDLVDSLSLNFARRAALDRPWLRPLWRAEARRLARSERRLVERARLAIVVAERDRRWLLDGAGCGDPWPAALAARLAVLPLALRSGASLSPESRASGEPPVVALTGNLGYFPTREGALWFARAVWPRIRQARPDARLVVAGARPPGAVRDAVITAGGQVLADPPDLAAILASAAVAVAPLRAGSGVPIKVLEAWRAGVPVVATAYAAAGTVGVPGEDFLVADAAAAFAAAVLAVLDDAGLAARLAAGGRSRLDAYDEPALAERLLTAVERAFA